MGDHKIGGTDLFLILFAIFALGEAVLKPIFQVQCFYFHKNIIGAGPTNDIGLTKLPHLYIIYLIWVSKSVNDILNRKYII